LIVSMAARHVPLAFTVFGISVTTAPFSTLQPPLDAALRIIDASQSPGSASA